MQLFLLIALACLLGTATARTELLSPVPTTVSTLGNYPAPMSLPATVYRISHSNRTTEAQLTLFTLQGALARSALSASNSSFPLLYKTTGTANTSTDGTWTYWSYYLHKYGGRVQFSDECADSSVDDILTHLAPQYISGYYLSYYADKGEADNVNAAISMAAVTDGAIVTTPAYQSLMKRLNISLLQDMRGYTESAFLYQFAPLNTSSDAPLWPFSQQFIACQTPTKAATFLSDWSMLASAVTLHHIPTAQAVLDLVTEMPFAWLGWTADTWGENDMTGKISAAGGYVWAADTQNNLGTHAFFRDSLPPLPNATAISNKGKHTVAFLFTDGDSLVADTGAVVDRRHWLDARRGSFPLSFGIDPSLAMLAPSTLGLMYDSAGVNDSIVAFAPGYAYPSFMPLEIEVWTWAEAASELMATAGLRINYYIDFNYSASYFGPLLQAPNIDGVVYFDYPNYYVLDNGRNGTVTWVNHKPAIAVRDSLWAGHSTPDSIATMLNQQSRDSTQTAGYSVIAAHLWSQDVGTISDVVEQLDGDGVVVVRLDELVALMTANVKEADRVTAEAPTRPSKQGVEKRVPVATE